MSPRDLMDYWPLFVTFVLMVAWFVRLEANVMRLEKDHLDLKKAESEKDKALWLKIENLQSTLNQVLIAIGELKGRISKEN